MKLALYKGRQRFISKVICYWTQSPYSHVELVFSDGMCGSSHDMDLGVRLKNIDFGLEPGQWDFIEIEGDEASARQWFEEHSKEPYDYLGLLSFIIPVKNNPYKWTCVKAVLTALGYDDAWRFEPSMLPAMIKGRKNNDLPSVSTDGVVSMAICGSVCTSCTAPGEDRSDGILCDSSNKRTPSSDPGTCGSPGCPVCTYTYW